MYSPLNIQASIAKYLAERFQEEDYRVFWFDTKVEEGVGDRTVTLVRRFPNDAKAFARQDSTNTSPSIIKVPAFTVYQNTPSTSDERRLGIGESKFFWNWEIGIDGFADNEFEWYKIQGLFRKWFGNPDTMITVFDYEADLSDPDPDPLDEQLRFINMSLTNQELDDNPVIKYYLNTLCTAEFVE
jgi:hypothetical protein